MATYVVYAAIIVMAVGIALGGVHGFMKWLREQRGAGRDADARQPASRSQELIAAMQKQAVEHDRARREEMRHHVERPVPTLTPESREVLQKASETCLAIRHVFPPRHPQRSFSFLGGKPLAPDNFDWPLVHNRKGLLEPLTFMGQVDCSKIPGGASRSILPNNGVLYFFAPMAGNHGDEARHFVVRYVPKSPGASWSEHDNTVLLPPVDGLEEARHRFKWMNWRPKADRFYPRYYPRVELELGWVEYGGKVQSDDPDAETGFPWQVAQARHGKSLIAFHGEPIDHDPLLGPRGKPTDTPWQPYEGFPSSWGAIEIVLGHLRVYLSEEQQAVDKAIAEAATPELEAQKAAYERLLKAANDPMRWHSKPELAEPTAEDRQRFAVLLQSLTGPDVSRAVERRHLHKQLPAVLNEWLSEAAILSAEACLADPKAADRIPASAVNALQWRHSVLKRMSFESDGSYLQHQMLGRGRTVQVAADEMAKSYVLLLQLGPDEALGWRMGDNGVMQYWITPADLAACQFDRTVLTFESH
ncbi:MAG TPA: DUF1963 domain-containing protein [Dongiaceae bacterium]|nr:DUF1963 domain-containing protein [Dongiaceae bacterium]